MLFNSYIFIFAFLPIVLAGYFFLLHQRIILGSKIWLVAASLFFYGYWNVVYIPLLLFSIFVNFFVGTALAIDSNKAKNSQSPIKTLLGKLSKKQLLIFGILFNVGLLGYFKYTDFFLENFNGIFGSDIPLKHIVLPLGISFFTFTQIAFLVDAYKEKVKEYDLLNYMLFVTYFPHLLAGPILHHSEMMPQFISRWNWAIRWRNMAAGLLLFSVGIFKKVIIADTFAVWANAGFDAASALNFFEAWVTSLSYTLQLYFDFSGYTDMAIGISLMFNIRLPINFNSPYKAVDIQDFWRRWHITLSRFLRDYIYIPLGGNRVGIYHNYFNLFAVFLIGGLWHGASWMFVIWGALHGAAIVIHRVWKDFGFRMWGWLGWFITFNFVNIAWVFFRAKEWKDASKVFHGMFLGPFVLPLSLQEWFASLASWGVLFANLSVFNDYSLWWIGGGMLLVLWAKNINPAINAFRPSRFWALFGAILFVISLTSLSKLSEFLYFNF